MQFQDALGGWVTWLSALASVRERPSLLNIEMQHLHSAISLPIPLFAMLPFLQYHCHITITTAIFITSVDICATVTAVFAMEWLVWCIYMDICSPDICHIKIYYMLYHTTMVGIYYMLYTQAATVTAVCPKEWLVWWCRCIYIWSPDICHINRYYMLYGIFNTPTLNDICASRNSDSSLSEGVAGAYMEQHSLRQTPLTDWQLKEGAAKRLKYQNFQTSGLLDTWISEYLDIWGFKISGYFAATNDNDDNIYLDILTSGVSNTISHI